MSAPIPLNCAECKALVGYFEPARLPRFLALSLRTLTAQLVSTGDEGGEGEERKPLPITCPNCARVSE